MASSLDDMESYELLQIELDRSLKNYSPISVIERPKHASILHFLNHWIEYICFQRHMSVWEEITSKETEETFWLWYIELIKDKNLEKKLYTKILEDFQTKFNKA